MTPIEIWLKTPAANALGWTVLHFVWQGSLIALLLVMILFAHSSRARYVASCIALAAMLASFGFTFTQLVSHTDSPSPRVSRRAGGRPWISFQTARQTVENRVPDVAPWIAPFWVAGVLFFHLRALAGWLAVRRLRRVGVACAEDVWRDRLNVLARRLRVSRPVALLESCLMETPVVIGHLRPVILMPVGLLTGLSVAQIDAILIHELAHIRRRDYVLNVLQTLAESLLFFHPAVWWVSRTIRAEREHCCDDWVLAMNCDAREYAAALTKLEEIRCAAIEPALAATGGGLVKRIRRLLNQPERRSSTLAPLVVGVAIVFTIGLAAVSHPSMLLAQTQQTPYTRWVNEDVTYIITDTERTEFNRLGSNQERERFIERFWSLRDPTPGTPVNEMKEEHYRRIAYANAHYEAPGIKGWRSDRGRIYIIHGPPDELESHPAGGSITIPDGRGGSQTATLPFEKWRYHFIEGVGVNVDITFVDRNRSGEFSLLTGR